MARKKSETTDFVNEMMNIQSSINLDLGINDFEVPIEDFETIPTGNLLFDIGIGGGIPKKAISVLWGEEHTGKSTLAIQILKSIDIYMNGEPYIVLYIDTEGRLTKRRLQDLNITNLDNIKRLVPKTVEDLRKITKTITTTIPRLREEQKKEIPVFMILDSYDKLTTTLALEEDKELRGGESGEYTKWLKQFSPLRDNITLIVVKQYRDNMQMFSGDTMSGARQLKHLSSLTLKLKQKSSQFIDDNKKATEIIVDVVKSSLFPNNRKFEYIMLKTYGIDSVYSLLNYLYKNKYLSKISLGRNGKGYYIKIKELDFELKDTVGNVYLWLMENPEAEKIWKFTTELMLREEYYGVVPKDTIELVKNKVYNYYFGKGFDNFKNRLTQSSYIKIKELLSTNDLDVATVETSTTEVDDKENIIEKYEKEIEE